MDKPVVVLMAAVVILGALFLYIVNELHQLDLRFDELEQGAIVGHQGQPGPPGPQGPQGPVGPRGD